MYFEHALELSEWSFPEIEVCDLTVDYAASGTNDEKINGGAEDGGEESQQDHKHSQTKTFDPQDEDVNKLDKLELDNLKREYESKIVILDNLLNKLKNPTSILDEELTELIQDIIRKIAKNIICREIEADKHLLPQMINELKALIDAKNGILSIYMSPSDFARLDSEKNNLSGLTNVDNELGTGDIIIKSNFAEVRALLNERIEQLIRIQHD